MLSGGTQRRTLPRQQCEEIKVLNILFHLLEWESNPPPVAITVTRLCSCATTDLYSSNQLNNNSNFILSKKMQLEDV